jgi:plasmid stability protein
MSKMIQVRHVPDDVHRTLKTRAAERGLSLSDYLRQELELIARRPTLDEAIAALEAEEPVQLSSDSATLIREIRRGT